MSSGSNLKIIHGDLDAFFAAVEQRDNPSLHGQPLIIGGNPDSRGVVATCSYEARVYGVKSAMPLAQAKRLCPQGIFLPVNMKLYQHVSRQVMSIMAEYTPLFEPISIDESFLDVSGCEQLFGSAEEIAKEIKRRVSQELGLTISMGISYNKFLAKLATELGKPDGLKVISREEVPDVLLPLPVYYLWGVGEKTLKVLAKMEVKTIGDLRQIPLKVLQGKLGSSAQHFLDLADGIDPRLVEPNLERSSMGKEVTFEQDVSDEEYLDNVLLDFSGRLTRRLHRSNLQARTVTLKVRYHNFQTLTRSKTIAMATNSDLTVYQTARELLQRLQIRDRKVRLIGLYLGNLGRAENLAQGLLFESESAQVNKQLDEALHEIRARFGENIITRASLLDKTSIN